MTRYRRECAIYLAAMIDGEGYVGAIRGKNGTYKHAQVSISNTDQEILQGVRVRLAILGISYREQSTSTGVRYKSGKEIQVNQLQSIAKIGDLVAPFMCSSLKVVPILELRDYYRSRHGTT